MKDLTKRHDIFKSLIAQTMSVLEVDCSNDNVKRHVKGILWQSFSDIKNLDNIDPKNFNRAIGRTMGVLDIAKKSDIVKKEIKACIWRAYKSLEESEAVNE